MSDTKADLPPAERVADRQSILDAMEQGVREALLRHQLAGNLVAVWRNGAVAWVPAAELLAEHTDAPE